MRELTHIINGQKIKLNGKIGVSLNPAIRQEVAKIPYGGKEEVDQAVASALRAFESWAQTPPPVRAKILFKYRNLIVENMDSLATLIAEEHGKNITESKGSIERGLEVLEFACGIPVHLKGEFLENVGKKIDVHAFRQPLGVCVGISPFNFPAMIPLWMAPIAIACGNTFIIKPSEKDPSAPHRLVELAHEAGLPEGVMNVVHGSKDAVNALITHPDVAAVSFVGQTATARYIQETATAHGKRVQAFGGAKNHMVIMPDADLNQVVEALLGAGFGSAGERCMAISVGVVVGDQTADKIVEALIPRVKGLKIGPYTDPKAEMGPLISQDHYEKVLNYVNQGVNEGADLVVDGRDFKHPIHPEGFFMGGCLFDRVTPTMKIYQEEIFGPVLCIVRAKDYEEAIGLASTHPYGNGTAIFTRDGDCARDYVHRVQVGMVGVNVPIPVPSAAFSFGGWKDSIFAEHGMHGQEGIRFFTKLKTTTSRWPSGIRKGVEFSLMTTETVR